LENSSHQICKKCLQTLISLQEESKSSFLGFDFFFLGYYSNILKDVIHLFKYKGKIKLGKLLIELLYNKLRSLLNFSEFDFIIPVPTHWRRLFQRGFDQTYILSKLLSNYTKIEVLEALKRVKYKTPQVKLGREERKRNIRGAFKLKSKRINLSKKRVILFDDVVTTGSTISECIKVLEKLKPAKLIILSIAKG